MSDILPLSVYLDTYSNETSAEVGKIVQMARTLESRIAELEGENHRMKVVLSTVHGQDQEISRLRDEKIALEAQTERDDKMVESARYNHPALDFRLPESERAKHTGATFLDPPLAELADLIGCDHHAFAMKYLNDAVFHALVYALLEGDQANVIRIQGRYIEELKAQCDRDQELIDKVRAVCNEFSPTYVGYNDYGFNGQFDRDMDALYKGLLEYDRETPD